MIYIYGLFSKWYAKQRCLIAGMRNWANEIPVTLFTSLKGQYIFYIKLCVIVLEFISKTETENIVFIDDFKLDYEYRLFQTISQINNARGKKWER